mmetsp:Transcript_33098/g.104674  ORF Transcript_33098/g.104674 Transcript_33098/m.104674 type:complete len:409 (-) Transcript_33098:1382-2608(-)
MEKQAGLLFLPLLPSRPPPLLPSSPNPLNFSCCSSLPPPLNLLSLLFEQSPPDVTSKALLQHQRRSQLLLLPHCSHKSLPLPSRQEDSRVGDEEGGGEFFEPHSPSLSLLSRPSPRLHPNVTCSDPRGHPLLPRSLRSFERMCLLLLLLQHLLVLALLSHRLLLGCFKLPPLSRQFLLRLLHLRTLLLCHSLRLLRLDTLLLSFLPRCLRFFSLPPRHFLRLPPPPFCFRLLSFSSSQLLQSLVILPPSFLLVLLLSLSLVSLRQLCNELFRLLSHPCSFRSPPLLLLQQRLHLLLRGDRFLLFLEQHLLLLLYCRPFFFCCFFCLLRLSPLLLPHCLCRLHLHPLLLGSSCSFLCFLSLLVEACSHPQRDLQQLLGSAVLFLRLLSSPLSLLSRLRLRLLQLLPTLQ